MSCISSTFEPNRACLIKKTSSKTHKKDLISKASKKCTNFLMALKIGDWSTKCRNILTPEVIRCKMWIWSSFLSLTRAFTFPPYFSLLSPYLKSRARNRYVPFLSPHLLLYVNSSNSLPTLVIFFKLVWLWDCSIYCLRTSAQALQITKLKPTHF